MSAALIVGQVIALPGAWALGFVFGSRWCASKVRASVAKVNASLDELETLADDLDAARTGGASALWTEVGEIKGLHFDSAAYQRLLDALEATATDPAWCDACESLPATHLVRWEWKTDKGERAEFYVCKRCLAVVVIEPGISVQELT